MSAFELIAAIGGTLLAAAAVLWITRDQHTGSVASSAPLAASLPVSAGSWAAASPAARRRPPRLKGPD